MDDRNRDGFPEIFDSHTHLFSRSVIASVAKRDGLAEALCLDTEKAVNRTDKAALKRELRAAGVGGCLILPTAPANAIRKVNDLFLETVREEAELFTAGTLHPLYADIDEEINRLSLNGVRALKFSSFSQAIDLEAEETFRLFDRIRRHNLSGKPRFFAIFDTFYRADLYFGAPGNYVTTPEKFESLVKRFPEIDFVGAHMGGLAAPFSEIAEHLKPRRNLYLETSNAAHLLAGEEFLRLLDAHGPERIIFGTDWPWFGHAEEIDFIEGLLKNSDFSLREQSLIFSGNVARLLGG